MPRPELTSGDSSNFTNKTFPGFRAGILPVSVIDNGKTASANFRSTAIDATSVKRRVLPFSILHRPPICRRFNVLIRPLPTVFFFLNYAAKKETRRILKAINFIL